MKYKVFVDGQEGTTGLKINEHLSARNDIEILRIDPDKRKDTEARRILLNEADVVFLCLPDIAAEESVSLIADTNSRTRIIDASTAHRTAVNWVYGLPELKKGQRKAIHDSNRVAVPGCYATGFVMLLYPLVHGGLVSKDYPVVCSAISGYSGGGKKLIEKFETGQIGNQDSPKPYALKLNHKHLPEMQKITGLDYPPAFMPVVADYYKGMAVSIPLLPRILPPVLLPPILPRIPVGKPTAKYIHSYLTEYYASERFVNVMPMDAVDSFENGFLDAEACNGTNRIDIFVFGNDDQILLAARLDTLGKGASCAAMQNMNIMLGLDEGIGLNA